MTKPEMVVSRVLGVEPWRVREDCSNTTLAEWDSLNHMVLVVALEVEYGLELSPEDAMRMTSLAAIKQVLDSRGVAW